MSLVAALAAAGWESIGLLGRNDDPTAAAHGIGPSAALTGPAARGDVKTVEAHLAALPADERDTYRALAAEARRLAGRREPGAGT
jgi:predicted short-subunit dehydrogenase-like oxidoreductase (DUF2520 family)